MEPTDCYMTTPPKVTDSVCMSGGEMVATTDMPEDAIEIHGQFGETVMYTLMQTQADMVSAVAVKYRDSNYASSCDIHEDVALGSSFDYESQCMEGMTRVVAVVYTGSFDAGDCQACDVEDLRDMGEDFCAYAVEIPCETTSVECGEPSAAPSGSFYPSSAPSDSPTVSAAPSASPSDSPSASPSDAPSGSPSSSPSGSPSGSPSASPSGSPSSSPSDVPSGSPSASPSGSPSSSPSGSPSDSPSVSPSSMPSSSPSSSPSGSPSSSPSNSPSGSPSESPSDYPSSSPSEAPSGSFYPSSAPSDR
jgi:hypothetical protein